MLVGQRQAEGGGRRCEVREKHCQKFARKKFIGTRKVYAVYLAASYGREKVCVFLESSCTNKQTFQTPAESLHSCSPLVIQTYLSSKVMVEGGLPRGLDGHTRLE